MARKKDFWLGFKGRKGREQYYSLPPDTYHRVPARSKDEAIGIFLKGTRFNRHEVVLRNKPPSGFEVGKNFASKRRQ